MYYSEGGTKVHRFNLLTSTTTTITDIAMIQKRSKDSHVQTFHFDKNTGNFYFKSIGEKEIYSLKPNDIQPQLILRDKNKIEIFLFL